LDFASRAAKERKLSAVIAPKEVDRGRVFDARADSH
jgi:hypothetical protein